MSKINQELVNKYFNTEKTVTKTIMIDGEAFDVVLKTKFTKAMEEQIVEDVQSLAVLFKGETGIEEINYIMLTTMLLQTLTDIEMPKERDALVAFLKGLVASGIADQVFGLLDEHSKLAVEQLNAFIINLAKAVDEVGKKADGSNGKNEK